LDIIEEKPNAKTAADILSKEYDFDLVMEPTGLSVSGDEKHPLTVEQAISVAGKMDAERLRNSVFYVKGKVCEGGGIYNETSGTASFVITDSGFQTGSFITCEDCLYLGQKKWTTDNPQIAVGDEVIVYGIMDSDRHFRNGQCALWSHNGKTFEQK
jgi:hypothetical protein